MTILSAPRERRTRTPDWATRKHTCQRLVAVRDECAIDAMPMPPRSPPTQLNRLESGPGPANLVTSACCSHVASLPREPVRPLTGWAVTRCSDGPTRRILRGASRLEHRGQHGVADYFIGLQVVPRCETKLGSLLGPPVEMLLLLLVCNFSNCTSSF